MQICSVLANSSNNWARSLLLLHSIFCNICTKQKCTLLSQLGTIGAMTCLKFPAWSRHCFQSLHLTYHPKWVPRGPLTCPILHPICTLPWVNTAIIIPHLGPNWDQSLSLLHRICLTLVLNPEMYLPVPTGYHLGHDTITITVTSGGKFWTKTDDNHNNVTRRLSSADCM